MKTLVTGASGFIGSAVVRALLGRGREVRCYLEPGANLRNLDGLEVEKVTGDVNDRGAVAGALKGCDQLFHLAAIYAMWVPDSRVIYDVNVEGGKTVLWAAFKAGLDKVVYTSSIAAIGRSGDGTPASEAHEFSARDWDDGNAYIRSKWLSERDALRFAREGLPLVVVNPAFPFGERDIGPTPTGRFIVDALKRKVPGYIDGGFCAIDVEDVAEGHVLAAEKGRVGERYILGSENLGFKEFFELVCRVAEVPAPTRRIPTWAATSVAWAMENYALRIAHEAPAATYKSAKFASANLFYDASKARRELGLPRTPLERTIEKAIRWFRQNGYA